MISAGGDERTGAGGQQALLHMEKQKPFDSFILFFFFVVCSLRERGLFSTNRDLVLFM